MKQLLFLLLVFLTTTSQAKNFYVSAAGNDANDGLTTVTAWQTLSKVNGYSFTSGDVILFRRGDSFYDNIVVPGGNLSFDAYGSGAKPIITGFTTLSGWTSIGGGVWQISAPSVKNTINMVTLNDVAQEVGRYPNSDAANGGYLTDDSYSGNTQYTCAALNGINWTGAEVVARIHGYKVERNTISAQSGSTIAYSRTIGEINPRYNSLSADPQSPPGVGFGLFIQRDIRTLDKLGEWYFNPSTKVMSMYFGAGNPDSYIIKASILDTGINIASHTNVSVSGLDFEGYNLAGVFFNDGSDIVISNCTINNSGVKGIFGWHSANTLLTNNTITNSLCGAIDIRGAATNIKVTNNIITSTGMLKGMSSFYDPADCNAIYAGANIIVRHNTIDYSGYSGIHFEGLNINVDSNFVNHYCMMRNDGGGIYAYFEPNSASTIKNNIIMNAGNPAEGTQEFNGSHGIYMDGGQGGVQIQNNSVANLTGTNTFGLFFNSPKNITANYNTVYNSNGWYVGRQSDQNMYGFVLRENIIFNTSSSQLIMQHTNNGLNTTTSPVVGTIQQSLQQLGVVDSNYYNMTNPAPFSWYYAPTAGGGFTFPAPDNFSTWQSYTNLDAHSKSSNTAISEQVFKYNASDDQLVYSFSGLSKKDMYGTVYNNSATIPAWSSKILIDNGTASGGNISPVANAGTDKTITLPTNTATLTGSGTDANGTISSYGWVSISGPSAGTITTLSAPSTPVNNLLQGVYKYELTVTDNSGAIGKDTVQVTVNRIANQAPIANAGTDKTITLPTNTATLTGSGTDANGTISSYAWVNVSGPSTGTIATSNAPSIVINNLLKGIYKYELTVTDNNGAIGKDTVQITVNPTPYPVHKASAGTNKAITLPTNITTLAGSVTDTSSPIISYKWQKIAGPLNGTIVKNNAISTDVENLVQGTYSYEFSATDNTGLTAKDTVQVTVNAAFGHAPVANAGINKAITLPVNSIILAGSGTVANNTISNYAWVKIAGPLSGTIAIVNGATTSVTNLTQGIYQYELTVTAKSGLKGKDTVQVTVNAAFSHAPVANAGINKAITLPVNSIILAGSGTVANNTISNYAWVKIAGPSSGTIATVNGATTSVTNLAQGIYQYELTVTAKSGLKGKDTVQVTVNAALSQAPVANAGIDKAITLPVNSIALAGSGIVANSAISSYAWVKIAGPASGTIGTANAAITVVNNLVQGVYKFELTITSSNGLKGKDTVQVIVNEIVIINQLPAANAGADINIVLPVNSATLMGSGSDPDGTIVTFNWKIITGPIGYLIRNANFSELKIENLTQGIYEFELTVADNKGALAKDTVRLTVSGATLSNYNAYGFKVYPNPVRDIANVDITAPNTSANTKLLLSVVDISGKTLQSKQLITSGSNTIFKLDMSDLINGYYVILLTFDNGEKRSTKVIKNGK